MSKSNSFIILVFIVLPRCLFLDKLVSSHNFNLTAIQKTWDNGLYQNDNTSLCVIYQSSHLLSGVQCT